MWGHVVVELGYHLHCLLAFIEVGHTNVCAGRNLYYVYLIQYAPINLSHHSTLGNDVFIGRHVRWSSVDLRKTSVGNINLVFDFVVVFELL